MCIKSSVFSPKMLERVISYLSRHLPHKDIVNPSTRSNILLRLSSFISCVAWKSTSKTSRCTPHCGGQLLKFSAGITWKRGINLMPKILSTWCVDMNNAIPSQRWCWWDARWYTSQKANAWAELYGEEYNWWSAMTQEVLLLLPSSHCGDAKEVQRRSSSI